MSKLTRRGFTKIATAASAGTALGSGRALGAHERGGGRRRRTLRRCAWG